MIDIDTSELERLSNRLEDTQSITKGIENALFNASSVVSNHAKKDHLFKTRTGLLENSIFTEVTGLVSEIFVSTDKVKYAEYIYFGTGLFGPKKKKIVPKTADVLAFKVGGAQFFAKSVDGIVAEPFIDDAYNDNEQEFLKVFGEEIAEELEGIF